MNEAEELVAKMLDAQIGNGAAEVEPRRGLTAYEKAMADGIGAVIADEIDPLLKRIAQLEATVAEMQAGATKFCGVWQRSLETYRRGSLVVHDNALFVAVTDTALGAEPSHSKQWQMVVKSATPPRVPTTGKG